MSGIGGSEEAGGLRQSGSFRRPGDLGDHLRRGHDPAACDHVQDGPEGRHEQGQQPSPLRSPPGDADLRGPRGRSAAREARLRHRAGHHEHEPLGPASDAPERLLERPENPSGLRGDDRRPLAHQPRGPADLGPVQQRPHDPAAAARHNRARGGPEPGAEASCPPRRRRGAGRRSQGDHEGV